VYHCNLTYSLASFDLLQYRSLSLSTTPQGAATNGGGGGAAAAASKRKIFSCIYSTGSATNGYFASRTN
jgi:hypothetical protein